MYERFKALVEACTTISEERLLAERRPTRSALHESVTIRPGRKTMLARLARGRAGRWQRSRCRRVAQDAYVVGLTGALTGPPASTYAPAVEALRIYIDGSTRPAASTARRSAVLQDDLGRARQGRRQRQEAADPGQRAAC